MCLLFSVPIFFYFWIIRGEILLRPHIVYRMGIFSIFRTGMSVRVTPWCPNIVVSPIRRNNILLRSIISRMGMSVCDKFSVSTAGPYWEFPHESAYISFTPGRAALVPDHLRRQWPWVKDKTVLNVASDRYTVGIVQMSTIYLLMGHFNCR